MNKNVNKTFNINIDKNFAQNSIILIIKSMNNSIEKLRKLINSLQINQRLIRESIKQLNEQNIKNQINLIIEENDKIITQLRNNINININDKITCDSNPNILPKINLIKELTQNETQNNFKQFIETNDCVNGLKKKLYSCEWPGCGYETVIASNINKHFCVHSGEKRFVCDWPQCHKRYQQSNGLMAHKRTHLGLKPFACDWIGCNYKTSNRCSLPAHKRLHKGIKPFVCDWPQCSVSCATITHLRSHKLTHSGEKPFKCDVCQQTFTKACNARAHKKSVHEGVKRLRTKNNISLHSKHLQNIT